MFEDSQKSGASRWPLVRVAAGGRTRVTLLLDRFLPLTVHWVGKSIVCPGDGCPLCCWLPARGLYYVGCVCDGRPSILELGSLSASHLEQHLKLLHQGMRPGQVVELSRRSAKAPVYAECVSETDGVSAVSLLELATRVMALYRLPWSNPGENLEAYEERLRKMAAVRCDNEDVRLRKSFKAGVGGQLRA